MEEGIGKIRKKHKTKPKKILVNEFGAICIKCMCVLEKNNCEYNIIYFDKCNGETEKNGVVNLCRCRDCKRLSCIHNILKCHHEDSIGAHHSQYQINKSDDSCSKCCVKCVVKDCENVMCKKCSNDTTLKCYVCGRMNFCNDHYGRCRECDRKICGDHWVPLTSNGELDYYCKVCATILNKKKLFL
jgi:hypothetical protein